MNNRLFKSHKKFGIFSKIFVPMLVLVIFQCCTFLVVSLLSGEFDYVKQYAQNILIEKTENRKNYIESELQQKMPLVVETAQDINTIVENILKEEGATIEDITTDKDLTKRIFEDTTSNVVSLLRRNTVNDVFLILETDTLYYDGDTIAKAGILIRDLDTSDNSLTDNNDLLMEMGSSTIAQEFNITLDSQWTPKLMVDPNIDVSNYDFYFKTLENAKANPNLELSDLGYWSEFSSTSSSATPSIKYSIPLIDSDGNVYGVLGVGIIDKFILTKLPSNDLLSENACYTLCHDSTNSGDYSVLVHSGAIYTRMVSNEDQTLYGVGSYGSGDIFSLDGVDLDAIGNVQTISLYNTTSIYHGEQWALVSLANEQSVFKIYTTILNSTLIALAIAIAVGVAMLLVISKQISNPITQIVRKLNDKKDYHEILTFEDINIREIDQLTQAITELQINVRENSSKVSKIISMVDIGIGVFTWDYTSDIVFIGESLVNLLKFEDLPKEDTSITLKQFMEYLSKSHNSQAMVDTLNDIKNLNTIEGENINETVYFDTGFGLNRVYFKLSIMQDNANIIGVVQDVTSITLERQKIEYERDYDITTGLLNRRAYYKKVEHMFTNPDSLKVSAFVMWDLDNLKYVNDTYGHDFGDDYIKTGANAFKQFKNYGGIVARMSGDEFNVFLSGFNSKEEILEVVNQVRNSLDKSYCLLPDGTHFKLRASGGISYYPYDATSYELLIKYADFAMYTIKHSTKGALAEFDMSTYNKDSILITGIEEMNRIIDEHSIKYAFQSIISAKTGEIYGYEALMRPQSKVFKSPLDLIRIAKARSKLYKIERLTWLEALKSFHQQIDKGKAPKGTKLFLNSISNCLIGKEDVQLIEETHKDILSDLVMEILEGEQFNMDFMATKINLIKKWKGKIALDDFGSGYNNEYALITLDPNVIKIDRSIISGCDNDVSRQNIIANLISLSKDKNILVLAEGVETYEELKTVIEYGVDLIQGYYVSRPNFEIEDVPQDVKQTVQAINLDIQNQRQSDNYII